MAVKRLPADLAKTLRKYGLKVVVVPGYKTRSVPAHLGGLNAVGVLVHHTATRATALLSTVLRLLIGGRPDLSGPLCNIGLGRTGTVYLIASGRANHAGTAKPSGSVAAGNGNQLYIGIEGFNDGVGEPWPKVQYQAYALLCAVLSVELTKNSAETVRGHKETSVTGKIDPTFNMDEFRSLVAEMMVEISEPKPVKNSRGPRVDAALKELKAAKGTGARMKNIQAAIAALKLVKPVRQD